MKNYSKIGILLTGFSLFCTGFTYIIDEYILAQTGTNILGNAAMQWPIIIGMMICSTAVAAYSAKVIAQKNIVKAFLVFEVLLSIIGGFTPLIIMWSYAYMGAHFLFVFYLLALLIGFLHGFQPVLIGQLNSKFEFEFKKNLALILSLDALGVGIGAIVYTWFILGKVDLHHAAFTATIVNLMSASVTYFALSKLRSSKLLEGIAFPRWGALLIIASFICAIIGFRAADGIVFRAEQQLFTGNLIISENTRYQHIAVTENPVNGVGMMYLNSGLQWCSADENIYHENLVHPAVHLSMMTKDNPTPLKVLVLGGGDGFAVRELKKYSNIKSITLVDLDPEMVRVAKTNPKIIAWNDSAMLDARVQIYNPALPLSTETEDLTMPGPELDSARQQMPRYLATVSVLHVDAYRFVEDVAKKGEKYDVIIIDFPDPRNESVGKLYSDYFFSQVRQLLARNGIICIQSGSPVHSRKSFLCVGKSMQAGGLDILPFQDNVPSFQQWGWYIGSNTSDHLPLPGMVKALANSPDFIVTTTYLTPQKFYANTFFGKTLGAGYSDIKVNKLLNPVICTYFREGWQLY